MFDKHLFPPGKRAYIDKKRFSRENKSCILCSIIKKAEDVVSLLLNETENFAVTVNLYPYNPGHIMIFPKRHITEYQDLTEGEVVELFHLQKRCMNILDKVYSPEGYNTGFNLGKAAGASIDHIHLHIVPRFRNELGFVDILAGSKIMVETPFEILEKLRPEFEYEK